MDDNGVLLNILPICSMNSACGHFNQVVFAVMPWIREFSH